MGGGLYTVECGHPIRGRWTVTVAGWEGRGTGGFWRPAGEEGGSLRGYGIPYTVTGKWKNSRLE